MAMEKSLKNNQRKRFKYNNNHFKMMIEIFYDFVFLGRNFLSLGKCLLNLRHRFKV